MSFNPPEGIFVLATVCEDVSTIEPNTQAVKFWREFGASPHDNFGAGALSVYPNVGSSRESISAAKMARFSQTALARRDRFRQPPQ